MTTLSPDRAVDATARSSRPRRFIVVGAGGRAGTFIEPLATVHREHAQLVGFCEPNQEWVAHHQQRLAAWHHPAVPVHDPEQLPQLIAQTRPDAAILCTPDYLHAPLTVRLLELGCDVIVEKPLAIDAPGCAAVLEAQARTGKQVRVTFNCRYMPWAVLIWKLLRQGLVGEIISMQIDWLLDAHKGVSYLSRWHAQKERSGGLLVHKGTHHLDLANWWLDAVPQRVFALGQRAFFGAENMHKHGIGAHGPIGQHYVGEDNSGDPFAPQSQTLAAVNRRFAQSPAARGYRPDRSVWRREQLNIEDTMSVLVQYRTGAILTYNLHAFLPRRGSVIVINGTRGRIELHQEPGGRVVPNGPVNVPTPPADAQPVTWRTRCIVQPLFAEAWEVPIPEAEGNHEGSDPLLAQELFAGVVEAPEMGRCAGAGQGAAAALIGIAGNESIASGQPVDIAELCPNLGAAKQLHELD